MAKKELSKHASILVYLGTHYEDMLVRHFDAANTSANAAKADDQNPKSLFSRIDAAKKLPSDLARNLKRVALMRNRCAHEKGFKVLPSVDDSMYLFNWIEDYFARLVPGYQPDHFCKADFEQDSSHEKIVYVEVPSAKTIYKHDWVIPRLVKAGLIIMAIALVIAIFAGLTNTSSSDYASGGIFGIGQDHYHNQSESPGALFGVIVFGGILAVIGWIIHCIFKKPKREAPKA